MSLISFRDIKQLLGTYRARNFRLVFTNGCFDLLHKGHLDLLLNAAAFGDKLFVGLNSDTSVKKLKGDSRPIQNEKARAIKLLELKYVDHVIVFEISELFISKRAMEIYFFVAFITFFVISLFYKNFRKVLLFETGLIIFLGFFFSKASLLLSFSVYFVFWHSIPSILDQLNFLYDSDNSRKMRYFLSSLPYWIMSVVGLFVFYFNFHTNPETFLPLFFSFLAAITFPHTIVMGWLEIYKTKSKSKN